MLLAALLCMASGALAAVPAARAVENAVAAYGSPHTWATPALAEVMGAVGFGEDVQAAIMTQRITGDILAQWDTEAELQSIHITSLPDRKRLAMVVKAMSSQAAAPIHKGGEVPVAPSSVHNLMELRELDKKNFSISLALLNANYRLALWHFQAHAKKGIPNDLHFFDQHPHSVQYSTFWCWVYPDAMVMEHWSGFSDTNYWIASGLWWGSFLTGLTNIAAIAVSLVCLGLVGRYKFLGDVCSQVVGTQIIMGLLHLILAGVLYFLWPILWPFG